MAHEHNHNQLVNTKTSFEPLEVTNTGVQLYIMKEYAYMMCRCNDILKVRIEDASRRNNPKGVN